MGIFGIAKRGFGMLKKKNKIKGVPGGKAMVIGGATAAGAGLVANKKIKEFKKDFDKKKSKKKK